MLRRLAPAASALAISLSALADVSLSPGFRDHAVLQRDKAIVVSGTAEAGENIQITFGSVKATATTGGDGTFKALLPAQSASSEPRDLVVHGKNEVVVHDILIGDVWLCSGQSNMEWSLGQLHEADALVKEAQDTQVRYFKAPHVLAWDPARTVEGSWTVATGDAARGCSAIGYVFAKELRSAQKVPIGILDLSWGGTRIEPWVPPSGVTKDIELASAMRSARQRIAKTNGTEGPTPETPSAMWNAMVAPFTTMAIRGVAWYQGESNANDAGRYQRILPLMIDAWRRDFSDPQLPFAIFSLAAFMPFRADLPSEEGWADLRESQRLASISRSAGLIVLLDIGDANDIHPARKAEAARRLSLWARATVYGEHIEYSGPVLKESKIADGAVTIAFTHAKGLKTRDGKAPAGFAIAGEDGKFVWADASIEGETVVVRSKDVPDPKLVRYAWHNNPETANLVNGEGLPASSFRTDRVEMKQPKRRD